MIPLRRIFALDRLLILLTLILSACGGKALALQTSTPIVERATSDVLVQASSIGFYPQGTEESFRSQFAKSGIKGLSACNLFRSCLD